MGFGSLSALLHIWPAQLLYMHVQNGRSLQVMKQYDETYYSAILCKQGRKLPNIMRVWRGSLYLLQTSTAGWIGAIQQVCPVMNDFEET